MGVKRSSGYVKDASGNRQECKIFQKRALSITREAFWFWGIYNIYVRWANFKKTSAFRFQSFQVGPGELNPRINAKGNAVIGDSLVRFPHVPVIGRDISVVDCRGRI